MKLYLVGGTVRRHVLGLPVGKDFDFAVEAESYEAMRVGLLKRGLHIWQERPEFVCIRGQIMRGNLSTFGGVATMDSFTTIDADFTLCREETQYSDRRHPDTVTPCSIEKDLSRRDFTVNAVAVREGGMWLDPHDGLFDAENRTLRCVGDPHSRLTEDPLRVLRAVRFAICEGLIPDHRLGDVLADKLIIEQLQTLPHERVREELNKALAFDWRRTMQFLLLDAPLLGLIVHRSFPNLWLKATTEER